MIHRLQYASVISTAMKETCWKILWLVQWEKYAVFDILQLSSVLGFLLLTRRLIMDKIHLYSPSLLFHFKKFDFFWFCLLRFFFWQFRSLCSKTPRGSLGDSICSLDSPLWVFLPFARSSSLGTSCLILYLYILVVSNFLFKSSVLENLLSDVEVMLKLPRKGELADVKCHRVIFHL